MFAVIEAAGKQFFVSEGVKIKLDKALGEKGDKVSFDKVLLAGEENNPKIGLPYLEGAKVEGEIIRAGRTRKIVVFHYHSKTRYRKKNTHRQHYSEVLISKISK